jgi:hypothetical protein
MAEGNFNEVLGVSFNIDDFNSALDQMVKRYSSFIDDVNKLGDNIKSPLSVSSDNSAAGIEAISTQLAQLSAQVNTVFETMTAGFSGVGDAAKDVSTKAKLDPAVIRQNEEFIQQYVSLFTAGESAIAIAAGEKTAAIIAQDAEIIAAGKAAAQAIAEAENISSAVALENLEKQAIAFQRMKLKEEEQTSLTARKNVEVNEAANAKIRASQESISQKRDVEGATVLGKQFAAEEKAAASLAAAEEKAASNRVAIQQKRDIEDANARGKAMQAEQTEEEKAATNRIAIYNQSSRAFAQYINEQHDLAIKEDNDRVRSAEEAEKKIQLIREQSAKAYANYTEDRRVKNRSIGSNPSEDPIKQPHAGGLDGFLGSLPETIIGVAKFQVAMAALNTVVKAAESPFTILAKIMKDGFAYDTSVQSRSQDLQAVLIQSVTYSKDFSENIKLAGEDAGILVRQIDDMAVKLRTNSDLLKVGFQDFLTAGGRNLTKNNQDALSASSYIVQAIQLSTKTPGLINREAGQEMLKAVDGTVKDGDKFLKVLGVSAAKWQEILTHAKQYHDLNDEIIANAPGLTERLKESGDNQQSLLSTLELYKARWEGLVAGPIFTQFTNILKQILDYLDKHSADLTSMGEQLGEMVKQGADFVKIFLTANWDGLVNVFKDLAKLLVGMVGTVQFITSGAIAAGQVIESANQNRDYNLKVRDVNSTRDKSDDQAKKDFNDNKINYSQMSTQLDANKKIQQDSLNALKDNSTNIIDIFKKWNENVLAGGKAVESMDVAIDNFGKGHFDPFQTKPESPHSDPSHGIITKPVKPSGAEGKAQYATQLQQIKEATEQFLATQKEMFVSNQETLDVYNQNTIKRLKEEKQAILDAGEARAKTLEKSGGKDSNAKSTEAMLQAYKEAAGVQKQINAEVLKDTQDKEQAKIIAYKNTATVAIQNAKNQYEALKANGASELELANKKAEIDNKEFDAKMVDLYLEQLTKVNVAASERARIEGQITEAIAARSGQIDQSDTTSKLAELHETLTAYDDAIQKNNLILEGAKQQAQLDSQSRSVNQSILEQQQDKLELDQKILGTAQTNLQILKNARDLTVSTEPNNTKAVKDANEKVAAQQALVDRLGKDVSSDEPSLIKIIFDEDSLKSLHDAFTTDFAQGVKDLTNAFAVGKTVFDEYNNGEHRGGLIGGIGAVLSGQGGNIINSAGNALSKGAATAGSALSDADDATSGAISGLGSILGAAGPFIAAIGPAFQILGDLLTAAAKKTAEEMQKQMTQIQLNLGSGAINLSQAIAQEQSTIQQTISTLSGEKGGQGELDSILPGMQQSLQALQQQQHQVVVTMDQNVNSLSLQQSYLQSAYSTWNQINQQVTDYVNAGGSIAEAAQFISDSLEQQKQQAATDLLQAESSAVSDAQSFNDLLKQRIDLTQQYNEEAFGLHNQDSIERKQATAVTAAEQLATQTLDYQTQLQQQDQQIDQASAKVTAEQQIFGIATDTASLQAESNSLALQSLTQQVQQWQAIQSIYNGIVQSSSGLYTYTTGLANLLGFTGTFGNDPTETYTGTNTITGYTGAGVGTSSPIGVGTSASGNGTVDPSSVFTGIIPVNGSLPVTIVNLSSLASGTSTSVGSGSIAGGIAAGSVPNTGSQIVSVGNITVTIMNPSGATIDATSLANDLQTTIINRNQYSGSSYYG